MILDSGLYTIFPNALILFQTCRSENATLFTSQLPLFSPPISPRRNLRLPWVKLFIIPRIPGHPLIQLLPQLIQITMRTAPPIIQQLPIKITGHLLQRNKRRPPPPPHIILNLIVLGLGLAQRVRSPRTQMIHDLGVRALEPDRGRVVRRIVAVRRPANEEDLIVERPHNHMLPVMPMRVSGALVDFEVVSVQVRAPAVVAPLTDISLAMLEAVLVAAAKGDVGAVRGANSKLAVAAGCVRSEDDLLVVGAGSPRNPWSRTWRARRGEVWADTRIELVVCADGGGLVAAVLVEVEDGLEFDGAVAGCVAEGGEDFC